MLHILCKRCKGWLPLKRGKFAYTYAAFKIRVIDRTSQIQCFCGRWTYDPRGMGFTGTKEQIHKILKRSDG